ncbi:hypothetical protein ACFL6X_01365 [Candidatus Latescibacterota bacterium]
MKTTLEIPDPLFREAKMAAAREGITLRAVVTRALQAELGRGAQGGESPPPWRAAFGGMRHLREESDGINRAVEDAFEHVDEDAWR